MSLKDKNVVVTGGSRGLGLGLVEALVAHDASVTVVARDADRGVGDRRQGRPLLASGGAQPAAQTGKPCPGGIEWRGCERIADVGRLRRCQAHALVHGQVRQRRRRAEGPGHPLPGDRAAADHRRHRGRRCGRRRLRQGGGHRDRGVSGTLRRADAAPGLRRESSFGA